MAELLSLDQDTSQLGSRFRKLYGKYETSSSGLPSAGSETSSKDILLQSRALVTESEEIGDELCSSIARRQLPYYVVQLAEKEVIEKLISSDNDLLPYILNDLLTQMSIYLEDRYGEVHLGAKTLRDPEEPDWEVIIILANADFGFKNLEHRFEVEDKIEEIVGNVIDEWREKVHKDDVGKVEEANAIISVIIDEE